MGLPSGTISALDFGIPYLTDKILRSLNFPYVLPDGGRKYYPTILAMISNRIDRPFAKYRLHHWVERTSLVNYPDTDTKKAFHHETCYSALDFIYKNQKLIEEELYLQRESPPRLFL